MDSKCCPVKPQKYDTISNSPQVRILQGNEHTTLDFNTIFKQIRAKQQKETSKTVVKLEVCSGSGEWIATRAKSELATNWVLMG